MMMRAYQIESNIDDSKGNCFFLDDAGAVRLDPVAPLTARRT